MRDFDGARLEAALTKDEELGDSAVRLLDARFIVELAKRGGRLVRRQELPDAAFLSLEEVKRLPRGGYNGDCLRAGSVSHAWQQPDSPDPKSISLKQLARFLAVLLEKDLYGTRATYAIFLECAASAKPDSPLAHPTT